MKTQLDEDQPVNHDPAATLPAQGIQPIPADQLLTKPQIADRLQVSTRTVDFWMAQGHLPFFKIGRCVRFCWPDVMARFRE